MDLLLRQQTDRFLQKIDNEDIRSLELEISRLRNQNRILNDHAQEFFSKDEYKPTAWRIVLDAFSSHEVIHDLDLQIDKLCEKIQSLQVDINSKQQSINSLTSKNRMQAEEISSLQLVSTSNKTLENELKSTKLQLKDTTEKNQLLKRKMENQTAELKNLNTKRTQVSALNAEISKLKKQLEEKTKIIRDGDNELYTVKKNVSDLEQAMEVYKEIISDLDNTSKIELVEDSSKECTICCEVFNEDRKKVAYGPCGHNIACTECSHALLRKTAANAVRGQKQDCPICRSEIKSTIVLQGIY